VPLWRRWAARQVPAAGYVGFFEELVAQDLDITLFELRDALTDAESVAVHHSAFVGHLKRVGFTHGKVGGCHRTPPGNGRTATCGAVFASLPAIARMPDRVVFLDETAVKTNLTRLRGWGQRGARLNMAAAFGSWGPRTLIAGLTHDALIAPRVIKGAMDGPAFAAHIRKVWSRKSRPAKRSARSLGPMAFGASLLDNLATHRNKEAAVALKSHGCVFHCSGETPHRGLS